MKRRDPQIQVNFVRLESTPFFTCQFDVIFYRKFPKGYIISGIKWLTHCFALWTTSQTVSTTVTPCGAVHHKTPLRLAYQIILFPGGEDLFEFLDEESGQEPIPSKHSVPVPITPAATPAASAQLAAPSMAATPGVGKSQSPGCTPAQFFPFGKTEPTAPSSKLSGVSSLKRIHR